MRIDRFRNRVAARRAGRLRVNTRFLIQPEPRSIGSFARGKQLCAGNLSFDGHLVAQEGRSPWDIAPPTPGFTGELHGFGWLDDLAAVGDGAARACAQLWLIQWLERFASGSGPAWEPAMTGRRLIRWIAHAPFLIRAQSDENVVRFLESLAQQSRFLEKRWRASARGLPRLEALAGLIHAGSVLEDMPFDTRDFAEALAQNCNHDVDEEGGVDTRNPEQLLEVFTLLVWSALVLAETDQDPFPDHLAAISRIAPTLRSLRHADGGLARFHGGGRGLDGRLDAALAASGVKARKTNGLAMGFARMSAGRTSMIVDAAPPPSGAASVHAHASTLAFEMTSGRRPVIVNCGSGTSFGPDWRRAGRATPSHSALVLNAQSSSQLGQSGKTADQLSHTPQDVSVVLGRATDGIAFEGGHDGYKAGFGLTHMRKLEMTLDGRGIAGEDILLAIDETDKNTCDRALRTLGVQGLPFDIRFHLHPDVDASVDMNGMAVSLALKSGEIWIFRFDITTRLSVEPSVYLERNRLTPRSTKQIVLSGRTLGYATRMRWSLSKPQGSPVGIRDLAHAGESPVAVT
ncbi:MAG: heparinase II/III family protein [Pseudomonadota bacterium]